MIQRICTMIILLFLISNQCRSQDSTASIPVTVSVLAIGNEDSDPSSVFTTVEGVNSSAQLFLNCFKQFSVPCLLQSALERPLSKEKMLNTITNFVKFVEQQPGQTNFGIIYYCGHGISSKAGSSFLIPGSLSTSIADTTYEILQQKLLNVDEIRHIIIDMQIEKTNNNSRYVLLLDCCSDVEYSGTYTGISYKCHLDSTGALICVTAYDSTAIRNMMARPSILSSSAGKIFSTLANGTDEMRPVQELIRVMTFTGYGNSVISSSPFGEVTQMVEHPFLMNNLIGPICRRTILYFKDGITNQSLQGYFNALIDSSFDNKTRAMFINADFTSPNPQK